MTFLARLRARRMAGDRGAAMIELGLVVMLLITLSLGIVEFGWAWRSSMSTVTATRSGSRTAASLGKDPQADYFALTSLKASLESSRLINGLQRVVVFRADSLDGTVPTACKSGTPTAGDRCNVYTGDQVRGINLSQFDATTGCMTAAPAKFYCPNTRNTQQATADYLGVFVELRHGYVTKFFGAGLTINRTSVMRLEPKRT